MKNSEPQPNRKRAASRGRLFHLPVAMALAGVTLWSGVAHSQTILDPAWRVTPDTAKPGFKWNYFQNNGDTANSTARTEAALAGLLIDGTGNSLTNFGDPTVIGAALAEAAPASPDNALLFYEIADVINLNKVDGGGAGNFPNDVLEPGLNLNISTDGQAAEILTYLTLPAGTVVMGVSSVTVFKRVQV